MCNLLVQPPEAHFYSAQQRRFIIAHIAPSAFILAINSSYAASVAAGAFGAGGAAAGFGTSGLGFGAALLSACARRSAAGTIAVTSAATGTGAGLSTGAGGGVATGAGADGGGIAVRFEAAKGSIAKAPRFELQKKPKIGKAHTWLWAHWRDLAWHAGHVW